MENINIGSRLLMAASFIENGNVVCDVGCDHGKLSLYLIKNAIAKHIIATDINPKPLQKAIDLFQQNGLSEKAEFFCTDGLQNISDTNGITHVVIAGMGGGNMAQIIENAPFIKENRVKLVLLPAQKGYMVREFLYQNGYEILKERTVAENGKHYTCIEAVYSGNKKERSIFDIYIGKSYENTGSSALGYFNLVFGRLKNKYAGLKIETGKEAPDYIVALEKIQSLIDRNTKDA